MFSLDKVARMGAAIFHWVDSMLFGSALASYQANRTIQSAIDGCEVEQYENDPRHGHAKPALEAELTLSIQQIERIENKAMSTLLGITIAIAIFGATSGLFDMGGLLNEAAPIVRLVAALILILAMLYLIWSGLLALSVYKIKRFYRPNLSSRPPLVVAKTEANIIIYSIEQNQRVGTLCANQLSASFNCLRNGLVLVAVLGVFVVVAGG